MSDKPIRVRFTRTIRFSDQEWRSILERANAADLKPTVFVRKMALGQRLRPRPNRGQRATARALVDRDRQLAWIGNNLNQLVKLAHRGRLRHGRDFLDVLDGLRRDLGASRDEVRTTFRALVDPQLAPETD